jgi:hypothetical protein
MTKSELLAVLEKLDDDHTVCADILHTRPAAGLHSIRVIDSAHVEYISDGPIAILHLA